MKFEFDGSSSIEAELIDRCIAGEYVVDITTFEEPDIGPWLNAAEHVIVERSNHLLSITVRPWSVGDEHEDLLGDPVVLETSNIDLLYVN